jgi:hypothetical protein
LEEELLRISEKASFSNQRFFTAETFVNFADLWKKYLLTTKDEVKKKIIHKFIKKIEVGRKEVSIEWLVVRRA